ncbi:MAG TPA: GtrA family protein [Candidatus Scybalousia intestinigallinarum]|nr:GtrA family protein [Candidatus Scybalousia intestinigallinarum]
MIKKQIKKHKKLIDQILKFGVVGGLAFLIDYGLLYVLTEFVGIHYLISSVISFTVSLIFNYILSIKWVFDVTKKQTVKEITIFVILSVIGLGINQVVMYVGSDLLHVYYMLTKIVATAIVMVWNFVTRKIFIEK